MAYVSTSSIALLAGRFWEQIQKESAVDPAREAAAAVAPPEGAVPGAEAWLCKRGNVNVVKIQCIKKVQFTKNPWPYGLACADTPQNQGFCIIQIEINK